MVYPSIARFLILPALIILLCQCTGTRYLNEGEYYLAKPKIHINTSKNIEKRDAVRFELEMQNLIKPSPNSKFLGMRPGVVLYHMMGTPKREKGIRYFIKYKIGGPPKLFSHTSPQNVAQIMDNRMFYHGFFHCNTTQDTVLHKHSKHTEFHINEGPRYTISKFQFEEKGPLADDIQPLLSEKLFNIGDPFDLDYLSAEQNRLIEGVKNQGYYGIDADLLRFTADTSYADHSVSLTLNIVGDEKSAEPHVIDSINVFSEYSLEPKSLNTIKIGQYWWHEQGPIIRPEIVLDELRIYTDSLYSLNSQRTSIKRLSSMNTYRYATINYKTISPGHLSADVLLTPFNRRSLSVELNSVSKSNNFSGPGIRLTYSHRNLFRGAEYFQTNLNGRYEQQYSKDGSGDTSFEISLDANLTLPRIVPFRRLNQVSTNTPFSNFKIGFGVFRRVNLYGLLNTYPSLEYSWKTSKEFIHRFKPIDITHSNLIESSPEFEEYLKNNPSIERSFRNQFITGTAYSISRNKLSEKNERQYFYEIGVDMSGNLYSALFELKYQHAPDPDNPYTIIGQAYNQFTRGRFDLRYYFKIGEESRIATRLTAGAGVPYGNSSTMPYVKQFFVGGTNSVRAFAARSVGPGTYAPPDSLQSGFIDQSGDIKIEGNVEYRFPIVSFLKGAFFVDAGNVWLVNEDEIRPGSKFDASTFMNELAVGAGFGLRIDISVIIRFDWAIPLRKPWLPEGERWVVKDIDPFNYGWRQKNLLLNISIGYPF